MIYWVCRRIQLSVAIDFVVATDSEEIKQYCDLHNFDCLLTPNNFENGTERVAYIANKKNSYSLFVNVQADEPLLNTSLVNNVISQFKNGAFNVAVSKLDVNYVNNVSEVKKLLSFNNRIRFASRCPIPLGHKESVGLFKIHGVYSYDLKTLAKFLEAPVGPLENLEKVEQLRCIENDIPLYGVHTEGTEISVDTQADYDYMLKIPKSKFEQ